MLSRPLCRFRVQRPVEGRRLFFGQNGTMRPLDPESWAQLGLSDDESEMESENAPSETNSASTDGVRPPDLTGSAWEPILTDPTEIAVPNFDSGYYSEARSETNNAHSLGGAGFHGVRAPHSEGPAEGWGDRGAIRQWGSVFSETSPLLAGPRRSVCRMAGAGVSQCRAASLATTYQTKRLTVLLAMAMLVGSACTVMYVATGQEPPDTYWYLPVSGAPYRPDNVARTPMDIANGEPNTERFPGIVEMPGRCQSRESRKTIATSHVAAGTPGGWSDYFEQTLAGKKNLVTSLKAGIKEMPDTNKVERELEVPYLKISAMDAWRRNNPGYKVLDLDGEEYISKTVNPHSQMQCESLCTSREGCHGYEFIPTSGACKLWRSIPSSETIADKGSICVKYYGTPKPNMARVVTRHLKSDMPSMPYIILRGVGNDLPPRHAVGQGYTNVKFMLENHPDYEGVRTIWVTFLFSHEFSSLKSPNWCEIFQFTAYPPRAPVAQVHK